MKQKVINKSVLTLFVFLLFSIGALANKTSVKIIAPEKAEKGTEITIKVEVKHVGNTKAHYTEWVTVKVNGVEYKKLEYSPKELPAGQSFTVELKIKADSNLEIIAKGNCNKHGSKGEARATVTIE